MYLEENQAVKHVNKTLPPKIYQPETYTSEKITIKLGSTNNKLHKCTQRQ